MLYQCPHFTDVVTETWRNSVAGCHLTSRWQSQDSTSLGSRMNSLLPMLSRVVISFFRAWPLDNLAFPIPCNNDWTFINNFYQAVDLFLIQ